MILEQYRSGTIWFQEYYELSAMSSSNFCLQQNGLTARSSRDETDWREAMYAAATT